VILTEEERLVLTPTYHVMEMYTIHHDAVLLPTEVRGPSYSSGTVSLPALSVSASRDREGIIHLSLVNIDPGRAQEVVVEVRGSSFTSAKGRVLKAARIQDHNTFAQPDKVTPANYTGFRVEGPTIRAQLPPCSVVVLALH
jgi:alpha-N-arabinofuranosidase